MTIYLYFFFLAYRVLQNELTSGQLIILQDRYSKAIFCVANTHILFNMFRGDLKLGQLTLLLAHVQRATASYRGNSAFRGVFLCGDFNMEPHSPLYSFLRFGRIRPTDYNRATLARHKQSARYEG